MVKEKEEKKKNESQVLNSKPMRRNLIRFRLREHISMKKKKSEWGTATTFQPIRDMSLLSQLKEALLSELYLWRYSSFMYMMPAPFSPCWMHFCQYKVLKNLFSLLCFNMYKFLAMWIKHRSSLDNSISVSVLFCAVLSRFSRVQLSVTPGTVAWPGPLSMGCSKQQY